MSFKRALAIGVLAASSHVSVAQGPVVSVQYRPTCSTCRITFTQLADIGSESDSVLLSSVVARRDSKGNFYAMGFGRQSINVYDNRGRFKLAIGKSGNGPNEFGYQIDEFRVVNDSLFVAGNRGMLLVYGPDHSFVRSVKLPRPPQGFLLPLPNGTVVIDADIYTPGSVGMPLHIVDREGKVIKSFGALDPVVKPNTSPPVFGNLIAEFGTRFIWHWIGSGYRGERWNVATATKDDFEVVDVPWRLAKPPVKEYRDMRAQAVNSVMNGGPPVVATEAYPTTALVRIDSNNRLWIEVSVPHKVGAARPAGTPCDNTSWRPSISGYMACTFVDVIDLGTKQLLLSQPLPPGMTLVSGTDLASRMLPDASGITRVRYFQVSFSR